MEIKYRGILRELTPEFIMKVGGIGKKAARNRIKAFLAMDITIEQLLFKGSYTNNAVRITKDGHTWTAPKLSQKVPNLTVTAANKRLQKWKAGALPYERLFAPVAERCSPPTDQGSKEWQALSDIDRMSPQLLRITPFERELGREIERAWGYVDA